MPAPRFTDDTLAFLNALAENNDREWFRARKPDYERHVRQPMIDVIEQLAADLPRFAPDLVAAPKASMYRVYRDTRFSADKSPLKTHVAAVFPHRALTKHGGAGMYLHVARDHTLVGGGIYAPEPRQLYRLREHVAADFERLRGIVESPAFRRAFGEISGERLKRVPVAFPKDHPAAEYLKLKQFLVGRQHPADFATGPASTPRSSASSSASRRSSRSSTSRWSAQPARSARPEPGPEDIPPRPAKIRREQRPCYGRSSSVSCADSGCAALLRLRAAVRDGLPDARSVFVLR